MIVLMEHYSKFFASYTNGYDTTQYYFDIESRSFLSIKEYDRNNREKLKKLIIVPKLFENDVISSFLSIYKNRIVCNTSIEVNSRDDYDRFINYSDKDGAWLHDKYHSYRNHVVYDHMWNWIFINRIKDAVVYFPTVYRYLMQVTNSSDALELNRYIMNSIRCETERFIIQYESNEDCAE